MKRVELFFDLSSPYSYLAATQIDRIADKHGAEVAWRPFVLHAVFQATNNTMPARVESKARWMFRDLALWAQHYGVPFQMSSRFPFNAIKAMRMILAAARDGRAGEAARAAFDAAWVHDRDLTAESELRAIARAAGLDEARALAAIEEPAIKDELRKNGEEAVARGAFGAPAIFVGDQLFWGNDRLHFVEAALQKL